MSLTTSSSRVTLFLGCPIVFRARHWSLMTSLLYRSLRATVALQIVVLLAKVVAHGVVCWLLSTHRRFSGTLARRMTLYSS